MCQPCQFCIVWYAPSPHQHSKGLYFKTFYCRNCCHITKSETVCHCHSLPPSLIFAGKDRSLLQVSSLVNGSTLAGSYPYLKILHMGELDGSGKQCRLVWYGNNYCSTMSCHTSPTISNFFQSVFFYRHRLRRQTELLRELKKILKIILRLSNNLLIFILKLYCNQIATTL